MKHGVLIYPHQLFAEHPALEKERAVYLIEEPLYFSQYKFHKQKIVLHRASMKAYEERLTEEGYMVHYLDHAQLVQKPLLKILSNDGISDIHVADVVDDWLTRSIKVLSTDDAIDIHWYETPQFLTSDTLVREYWGNNKRHLQQAFYIWQRKRLNVLIDSDNPVGGAWSYDEENRKPLPKNISIPSAFHPSVSEFVTEAIAYVEEFFPDHYGSTDTFEYAITHEEAERALTEFLENRLAEFGPYEDAISVAEPILFHSVLSPYLNSGLLTPQQVLDTTLAFAKKHTVQLSSLEGFIRQLIGWREFIRMVYVCDGARMRVQNTLSAKESLPESWWTGTTGIAPIDHTIETLKKHAYTHHIPRLMVIGNMMTLLGIQPHDGYRWFMEWYIDAYDWVMVPNVYGMALYADGGSITTKPYVSSSRYIKKMSDYDKGPWQEWWDALYWNFVDIHRDIFAANHRASFAVSMLNRFSDEKKAGYKKTVAELRARLWG